MYDSFNPKRYLGERVIVGIKVGALRLRSIAEATRTPESTLSKWMHGAAVPNGPKSTAAVRAICALIDVPFEQAFASSRRFAPTLEGLLESAQMIAADKADGHLTIFRFTTGWAAMLKTPYCREQIAERPKFQTLAEALKALIKEAE